METREPRPKHARVPWFRDEWYTTRDQALCGTYVHLRETLAYADFRQLRELQQSGRLNPDTVPLCDLCIQRLDTV